MGDPHKYSTYVKCSKCGISRDVEYMSDGKCLDLGCEVKILRAELAEVKAHLMDYPRDSLRLQAEHAKAVADNAALVSCVREIDEKFDYLPARLLFTDGNPGAALLEDVAEARDFVLTAGNLILQLRPDGHDGHADSPYEQAIAAITAAREALARWTR